MAIAAVGGHYHGLFRVDPELADLRLAYAIPAGSAKWNERPLAVAFWTLNGGLLAMGLLSLLPVGMLQTVASIEHGLWYARSAEFLQTETMQTLRWLRVVGDTVFAVGVVALVWFGLRRKAGANEGAQDAPAT